MTDDQRPPQLPELELARPVGSRPGTPADGPPAPQAVRTAARAQPLPTAPAPRKMTRAKLQEGAADTLLNSVSILGELIEDFRTSDRFFKYKALVVALWLGLSVGAFGVACPSESYTNEVDARLIVSGDAANPIYMVKNESNDTWESVEILVNDGYRSTLDTVEAVSGTITLSPAVLFDADGHRAPSTLKITDITLEIRDPDARVVLLKDGELR